MRVRSHSGANSFERERDNGEDGKTENTQGRPDSSYSLQELLIFPQPMLHLTVKCMYTLLRKQDCAVDSPSLYLHSAVCKVIGRLVELIKNLRIFARLVPGHWQQCTVFVS